MVDVEKDVDNGKKEIVRLKKELEQEKKRSLKLQSKDDDEESNRKYAKLS